MIPRLISILIPTHNRREILAQTLDSLRRVEIPTGVSLELVVVANACTDGTEQMVSEIIPTLPFPVRCVSEPNVGLNVARNRCVHEASGEILSLLDDDVWVEPHWAIGLWDVYQKYPADIVVGRVFLWWQAVQPPQWLTPRVESLLSSFEFGDEVKEIGIGGVGANFTFHRRVIDAIGQFRPGLDRVGSRLLGGGEIDFMMRAHRHGLRSFYAPRATVKHWVAPQRLTEDYIKKVAFGIAQGAVFMKMDFGLRQIVRALLGHSFLICKNWPAEWWARLRSDEKGRIDHLILRRLGQGGLVAAMERIFGRSPVTPMDDFSKRA